MVQMSPTGTQELKKRLLNRITIVFNGCWVWQGSCVTGGYGNLTFKCESLYAHRASWEVHNGPIPVGMSVLHKCDNRRCINPEHLFLGTQDDNIKDMYKKGRQAYDYKCKLTEQEVLEIKYKLRHKKFSQEYLAKMYDISRSTILAINLGHNWSHVPWPDKDPSKLRRV